MLVLRWSSSPGITAIDYVAMGVGAFAVWGYFAFVLFAARRNSLPIPREQAGDNAYYIGLLLTFLSLAVALVKLVAEIQGNSPTPTSAPGMGRTPVTQLIPDFGIALFSTICGIAARMILQQQANGLPETRETTRRSLEQASNEFVRSLTVSTGSINTAISSLSTGITDQIQDLTNRRVEEFTQISDAMREVGTKYCESAQTLLDKVEATHDIIATELDALATAKLGENFQTLSLRALETQAALAQMKAEIAANSEHAQSVTRQFSKLTDQLQSIVPASGIDTFRASVDEANQRSNEFNRDLMSAHAQVQSAKAGLDEFEKRADEFREVSLHLRNDVERVSSRLDTLESDTLRAHDTINASTKSIGDFEESIETVKKDVTNTVTDIKKATSSHIDLFQKSIDELDEFNEEVGKLRGEVKKRRFALSRLFSKRK